MKYLFTILHRWGFCASVLLGFLISIIDPKKYFLKNALPFMDIYICKKYFYEESVCPVDIYSVFITNIMVMSISILTITYVSLFFIWIFLFLNTVYSTNNYAPKYYLIINNYLAQLIIAIFGLFVFWGKGGLTYIDAALVAIANTISLCLLYDVFLFWVISVFNLFSKRELN